MATHCELKTGGEEMRLKNKISVITGAGRGIGRSISFAEEGSNLVLVARSRDQLENVAQEIRNRDTKALPVTCDVSSAREVQDLARVVQDEYGLRYQSLDQGSGDALFTRWGESTYR
jgi:NADP-dependent 3-hydroxy acid dehydrogenase YdfG